MLTQLFTAALSAGSYYLPAQLMLQQTPLLLLQLLSCLAMMKFTVGTTVASGDGFMHNDGGTMAHKLTRLQTCSQVLALQLRTLSSVDLAQVDAAVVDVANDSILIIDANDATKKESVADLAVGMAGDGLTASGGVLAVQVSGAAIIASDKVGISGSVAGAGPLVASIQFQHFLSMLMAVSRSTLILLLEGPWCNNC